MRTAGVGAVEDGAAAVTTAQAAWLVIAADCPGNQGLLRLAVIAGPAAMIVAYVLIVREVARGHSGSNVVLDCCLRARNRPRSRRTRKGRGLGRSRNRVTSDYVGGRRKSHRGADQTACARPRSDHERPGDAGGDAWALVLLFFILGVTGSCLD